MQARVVSERHARARVREAKPAAQQWQPKDHPNADAKGNIGLSYFNVGDVTEGTAKGQHWATLIRKAPTVIFGISEATPDLKRMLEEPPCYKDPDPSNTNPQRPSQDFIEKNWPIAEWQYNCVLQSGAKKPCMIGVRTTFATELETLDQDAILHGQFKKSKGSYGESVSHYLICKIKLLHPIACMAEEPCPWHRPAPSPASCMAARAAGFAEGAKP